MENFFESALCRSRMRCRPCRLNEWYRTGIARVFSVPGKDFECPYGVTAEQIKDKTDTGGFPPLLEQAENVAGAANRVARAVFNGNRVLAGKPEYQRRLAICRDCEFFYGKSTRCRKCGCRLKAKLRLATEKCPVDKWDF